jgi:hypothetical protein
VPDEPELLPLVPALPAEPAEPLVPPQPPLTDASSPGILLRSGSVMSVQLEAAIIPPTEASANVYLRERMKKPPYRAAQRRAPSFFARFVHERKG